MCLNCNIIISKIKIKLELDSYIKFTKALFALKSAMVHRPTFALANTLYVILACLGAFKLNKYLSF